MIERKRPITKFGLKGIPQSSERAPISALNLADCSEEGYPITTLLYIKYEVSFCLSHLVALDGLVDGLVFTFCRMLVVGVIFLLAVNSGGAVCLVYSLFARSRPGFVTSPLHHRDPSAAPSETPATLAETLL